MRFIWHWLMLESAKRMLIFEIRRRSVLLASREQLALMRELLRTASLPHRRAVGEHLCEVFRARAGARSVRLYAPAGERSRDFVRIAEHSANPIESPKMTDEMGLTRFATESNEDVVTLQLGPEVLGYLLMDQVASRSELLNRKLDIVAGITGTSLACIAAREREARDAMKDPTSSAYTFAYFVDVAGTRN